MGLSFLDLSGTREADLRNPVRVGRLVRAFPRVTSPKAPRQVGAGAEPWADIRKHFVVGERMRALGLGR